ncbi:RnfABCDGE type electron transport complex subunit D [Ruminococcus champanellensis]|uniref:RnfABCDGE type electron transport complex subunit D n=1 Tax=Ruminococcus champanellensis TaxID=1161942 RepID=UPI0039F5AAA5
MHRKTAAAVVLDLFLVQLALLILSGYYYGIRVLILALIASGTCLALDAVCLHLRNQPIRAAHLDAVNTGLTLTLMMPASVRYDTLIITCFAAIIIGKALFGGRVNLLFPPAAVGYTFSILAFGTELLQFPQPYTALPLGNQIDAAYTMSASAQFHANRMIDLSDKLLLGALPGPMGTDCILLLTVGVFILIARRSVAISTLVTFLLEYLLMSLLAGADFDYIIKLLGCNMTLFGAIFLIADQRIAPKSLGGILYGFLAAILSMYLTTFAEIEYAVVITAILLSPLAQFLKSQSWQMEYARRRQQYRRTHREQEVEQHER